MSITIEQPAREGVIRLAEEDAVSGSRDWVAKSACAAPYAATRYDAWFGPADDPEEGQGRVIPKEYRKTAKGFCIICPVRMECLKYAMDNNIKHGIWGGLAPEERTQLRNKRAARAAAL